MTLSVVSLFVLLVLLALALIAPELGNRWFRAIEKRAAGLAARKRTTLIAVVLASMAARLALLWLIPVPVPAVHDEFSYLLAADTFAHGRLANPPHAMGFFLDTFHVQQLPTYASIFPPAQGAILAVGKLLGHPWIGVLLSTALMCAAMTWMLQGWVPPGWALLGGILIVLRWALFTYWVNSYWGGALAASGAAMVLGAFPRILHRGTWQHAVVMGIGAGLLANSRPVEGLIFCFPLLVALIVWILSRRSSVFAAAVRRTVLPFSGVMLLVITFMGYYNWRVTHNPLLFPHALAMQKRCNCPVFAWQPLHPPLHYPNSQFEDFYNGRLRHRYFPSWENWRHRLRSNVGAWFHFFLGTPLLVPFVTLPWLFRDRRMRLLLAQFFLCALGLVAVVWFEPHYAAPMSATLLVLLVQAFRHLRQWHCFHHPVGIGLSRVVVFLVIANVPAYVVATMRSPQPTDTWSISRVRIIRELQGRPDRHLIIVRYSPDHIVDDEWVYNSADIDDSKIVWVRYIPGTDLTPVLAYFKDREVWVLDADVRPWVLRPYTPTSLGLDTSR